MGVFGILAVLLAGDKVNIRGGGSPARQTCYKLQAYRTRTLQSEFCMGGRIRIDNLPYKSPIPALSSAKE